MGAGALLLPRQEADRRPGGPALRPAHRGGRHRADRALRQNGWIGQFLEPLGIQVAFKPLGVLVALVFIGLPFVVRTVQPVLEDLDTELEEAATSLGAQRWQAFRHVILPIVFPALLTGFALAFARAVGEYGSVIFIAGNLPMVSEITPLMIITKLEQYDYTGATAIATVMLIPSFALLLIINGLQAWTSVPNVPGGTAEWPPPTTAPPGRSADHGQTRFEARAATRETPFVKWLILGHRAHLLHRVPADAADRGVRRGAAQGLGAYLRALIDPDALSAIA